MHQLLTSADDDAIYSFSGPNEPLFRKGSHCYKATLSTFAVRYWPIRDITTPMPMGSTCASEFISPGRHMIFHAIAAGIFNINRRIDDIYHQRQARLDARGTDIRIMLFIRKYAFDASALFTTACCQRAWHTAFLDISRVFPKAFILRKSPPSILH